MYRPALIWRSATLRLFLAAIPAWCTVALLIAATWRVRMIIAAVAAVTIASPAAGLVSVALLTPFGFLLQKVVVLQLRFSEAIVVAFLAAWLLRSLVSNQAAQGPAVPLVMAHAGWLLGLAIVCSLAVNASRLSPGFESRYTKYILTHFYYQNHDWIGANSGMRLMEGLALEAATVCVFRQRPSLAVWLPIALGAGASACAIAGVWKWLYDLVRVHGVFCCPTFRIAAQTPGDVNAAGSYFAMILCLMLGMLARSCGRRARMGWATAALLSAVGLWFTLSRAALAAAALAIFAGVAWHAGRERIRLTGPRVIISLAVAVLLAAIAYGGLHTRSFGFSTHRQFYATSWRMIRARSGFGVGIGQYYPTSGLFLSPQLAWRFGFENAHNNWLQIGAELGFLGLGLFVAWIAASFVRAARALVIAPDARLLGAGAGTLAFVVTWLTSHPLLVDEAAFPFWTQTGLMSALAGSTLVNARISPADLKRSTRGFLRPFVRSRGGRATAFLAASAVVLACAAIGWSQGPVAPPESRDVTGLYEWETAPDGTRFRWMQQYASIFVPADTVLASLPVRLPRVPNLPRTVRAYTNVHGVLRENSDITDAWRVLDVRLPDAVPPVRYQRIDVYTERAWQPALYIPGSADMRPVAIQVGEWRLVHGR